MGKKGDTQTKWNTKLQVYTYFKSHKRTFSRRTEHMTKVQGRVLALSNFEHLSLSRTM